MHFILQKDSILIYTFRGLYICPRIDAVLNVLAKGESHPAIIHNYKGKAMLDFKHMKTWITQLRLEVNPATITGYTKNDWVYSDPEPTEWLPDPNYEKYQRFNVFNQVFRKDVKEEPHRVLDSL
jgi:hypothetical protein